MTHALDDLKQKPANELSLVECAILAADRAGEKNLAYRAADENNGMKIKNARAIANLIAISKRFLKTAKQDGWPVGDLTKAIQDAETENTFLNDSIQKLQDKVYELTDELAAKDDREKMAIILLGYCKPHVEAMVGIASSARGVPEMIDMFLDGTLKFEDAK